MARKKEGKQKLTPSGNDTTEPTLPSLVIKAIQSLSNDNSKKTRKCVLKYAVNQIRYVNLRSYGVARYQAVFFDICEKLPNLSAEHRAQIRRAATTLLTTRMRVAASRTKKIAGRKGTDVDQHYPIGTRARSQVQPPQDASAAITLPIRAVDAQTSVLSVNPRDSTQHAPSIGTAQERVIDSSSVDAGALSTSQQASLTPIFDPQQDPAILQALVKKLQAAAQAPPTEPDPLDTDYTGRLNLIQIEGEDILDCLWESGAAKASCGNTPEREMSPPKLWPTMTHDPRFFQ